MASEYDLGVILVRMGLDAKALKSGMKDANKVFKDLDKQVKASSKDTGILDKTFGSFSQKLSSGFTLGIGMQAASMIINEIKAAIEDTIRVTIEWEYTMTKVAAATGLATDATFEFDGSLSTLEGHIKGVANEVGITYTQAANAVATLSKNGYQVAEALSAIDDVVNLSRAGFMDLNTAMDITSATLQSFNLGTEQTAYITDVLTKAANTTSLTMEELQRVMGVTGSTAQSLGYDFVEVIGIFATLDDQKVAFKQGLSDISAVFESLVNPTKEVRDAFAELGITEEDMATLNFPELLDRVRIALEKQGKTGEAMLPDLQKLFGAERAQTIYELVEAHDALNTSISEISDSYGYAEEAAEKVEKTAKSAIDTFNARVENFKVDIGSAIGSFFNGLGDMAEGAQRAANPAYNAYRQLQEQIEQQIELQEDLLATAGVTQEELIKYGKLLGYTEQELNDITKVGSEDWNAMLGEVVDKKKEILDAEKAEQEALRKLALLEQKRSTMRDAVKKSIEGEATATAKVKWQQQNLNSEIDITQGEMAALETAILSMYDASIAAGKEWTTTQQADLDKLIARYKDLQSEQELKEAKSLILSIDIQTKGGEDIGSQMDELFRTFQERGAGTKNIIELFFRIPTGDLKRQAEQIAAETGRSFDDVFAELEKQALFEKLTGGFEDSALAADAFSKNVQDLNKFLGITADTAEIISINGKSLEQLGISSETAQALKDAQESLQKTADLELGDKLEKALAKYNELKDVTEKTAEQQKEYNKALEDMGVAMPEDITTDNPAEEAANQVDVATTQIINTEGKLVDYMTGDFLQGWTDVWNGMITVTEDAFKSINKGIETNLNQAIDGLNDFIKEYNKVASALGLKTIGTLGAVSIGSTAFERIEKPNVIVVSPDIYLNNKKVSENLQSSDADINYVNGLPISEA